MYWSVYAQQEKLVGIDWGGDDTPVLSAKDAAAPALADFDSPFTYEGPFDYEAKL